MMNYADLIEVTYNQGAATESRLGTCRELLGASVKLTPGLMYGRRGFSSNLAWLDALQALGGYFNADEIEVALGKPPRIPYNAVSAWGPYIQAQLGHVYYQLAEFPETRRATIHFQARPGEFEKPCCSTIQFLRRGGKLYLMVTMRSWDLAVGFLYDSIVFQMLLFVMAELLGDTPGNISVHVGSLHIYDSEVKRFGVPAYEELFKDAENEIGYGLAVSFPDLRAIEPFKFELSPTTKEYLAGKRTQSLGSATSYVDAEYLIEEIQEYFKFHAAIWLSVTTPESPIPPVVVTKVKESK